MNPIIGLMQSPRLDPGALDAPQGANYLTMDALLTYCESKMRGIDTQVQEQFARQKQANEACSALQELMSAVNACTAGGIQPGGRGAHDLIRAYQMAICKVGGDTPIGQKLIAEREAFIGAVGKNGGAELRLEMGQADYWSKPLANDADGQMVNAMSGESVKKLADNLKGLQSEINQGSELGMITLQSLMSQRQMAIQLTTNLVQSLGEMTNKIAANIGR